MGKSQPVRFELLATSEDGAPEPHPAPDHPTPDGDRWRQPSIQLGPGTLTLGSLISIALLAWARATDYDSDGFADVFVGSCDDVNARFTWGHLPLNVAAAATLVGSATCLWKTVPALKMRTRLGIWSAGLWAVLAIASMLLPIFWNAAFFPAPGFSDYSAINVSPSFMTGAPYQDDPVAVNNGWLLSSHPNMAAVARLRNKSSELVRIDATTCSSLTSMLYLSTWSNFLVVSDFEASNDTILKIYQHFFPFPLQGVTDEAPSETRDQPMSQSPWELDVPFCNGSRIAHRSWYDDHDELSCTDFDHATTATVQYCLGEPIPETCSLQMSVTIVILLLVLHLILLGGVIILWPDHPWRIDADNQQTLQRGYMLVGMMLAGSILAMIATLRGISDGSLTAAWNNIRFGQFDPMYLVSSMPGIFERNKSLLGTLVVANLPQIGISISWIVCSHLLVGMARHNRSPMRFGLIVVAYVTAVVFLQWAVSQSLFPVRFKWYDSNGMRIPEYDVVSPGYSFRGIVASIILYFAILCATITLPYHMGRS